MLKTISCLLHHPAKTEVEELPVQTVYSLSKFLGPIRLSQYFCRLSQEHSTVAALKGQLLSSQFGSDCTILLSGR